MAAPARPQRRVRSKTGWVEAPDEEPAEPEVADEALEPEPTDEATEPDVTDEATEPEGTEED